MIVYHIVFSSAKYFVLKYSFAINVPWDHIISCGGGKPKNNPGTIWQIDILLLAYAFCFWSIIFLKLKSLEWVYYCQYAKPFLYQPPILLWNNLIYTANVFPVGETVFDCVSLFPCRSLVPWMGIPCITSMTVNRLHVDLYPCAHNMFLHVMTTVQCL